MDCTVNRKLNYHFTYKITVHCSYKPNHIHSHFRTSAQSTESRLCKKRFKENLYNQPWGWDGDSIYAQCTAVCTVYRLRPIFFKSKNAKRYHRILKSFVFQGVAKIQSSLTSLPRSRVLGRR